MKKTYTVIGRTELTEYVTFTVEAESEEQALLLVEEGEVEDNGDHWTKESGSGMSYAIQK